MTARLDATLVKRGLVPARERAKEAIAAGVVFVNGRACTKPSTPVDESDVIEVRGFDLRYVGRGGLKLEKALQAFSIDLSGARCVDVGASTGGFTDCMLQAGASHVTAIDVGHGQLDPRLAAEPRVASFEGCDVRTADPAALGAPFDFAATDVSFIPLALVLPAISGLLRPGAHAVLLVKPQFEAGPEHVGKRGVVKDARVHRSVLERAVDAAGKAGLVPQGLDFSPVTGGTGNVEYLLFAVKRGEDAECGTDSQVDAAAIDRTVSAAHAALAR